MCIDVGYLSDWRKEKTVEEYLTKAKLMLRKLQLFNNKLIKKGSPATNKGLILKWVCGDVGV